ncbi:hypothetical protein F5Y17DRAFT_463107 [Xylariaceae sp. FL0594]|nr:hypothetical protein F5Y17DRAFT_463107 [Xylariaceae sp. FL0594]
MQQGFELWVGLWIVSSVDPDLSREINLRLNLYHYFRFRRQHGGRINALFHKPKSPPPEVYHVFKVLRHEKHSRGGFRFEVQWVGHPSTRGEKSMETETKLKSIAPELLDQYWKSVGGRDSHLPKRGRANKA